MTINRSVGLLSTPVRTCKVGMQMLPQEKHDKIKSSIYWEEPKQCCKHRHWDKIGEGCEKENIIKIGKNRKNWQTLAKLNKYKKILFFLNPQNYFINKSRRVPAIFCNQLAIKWWFLRYYRDFSLLVKKPWFSDFIAMFTTLNQSLKLNDMDQGNKAIMQSVQVLQRTKDQTQWISWKECLTWAVINIPCCYLSYHMRLKEETPNKRLVRGPGGAERYGTRHVSLSGCNTLRPNPRGSILTAVVWAVPWSSQH